MGTEDQWTRLLREVRSPSPDVDENEVAAVAVQLGLTVALHTVGCSITQAQPVGYRTPIASTSLALELDEAQYAAGTGPCVVAATRRHVQHLESISESNEYATFAAAAACHGVQSSYSVPLVHGGRPAALNLYAVEIGAFRSPRSQAIADLLARCITSADARTRRTPDLDAVEVAAARELGARVRHAQALVSSHINIGASAAYRRLADTARETGRSIAEVAEQVISDYAVAEDL